MELECYTPMPISETKYFPGAPVTATVTAAETDDAKQTGVWAVNLDGALTVLLCGADGKWTPPSLSVPREHFIPKRQLLLASALECPTRQPFSP